MSAIPRVVSAINRPNIQIEVDGNRERFGLSVKDESDGSSEKQKQVEPKYEKCPICLEKLVIVGSVLLPCLGIGDPKNKHKFHRECINKYIELCKSAPISCLVCNTK